MDSGDDLYIKMNSRGKPLTDFEIFKARFEKVLDTSGRQTELSAKFDREWSDLLWHYEGGNYLVDEEFMNYLAFVIDVCEWRCGLSRGPAGLLERAQRVFADHHHAAANLELLFFAFDTWTGESATDNVPKTVFSQLFSVGSDTDPAVRLFESQNPNLFEACLRNYGTNQFSLAETILLYAVVIFRQRCPTGSDEVLRLRLRSLRNLAESAPDEVRNEYMPDLIASTTKLMTDTDEAYLDGLTRFNQARIEDERRKRDLMAESSPEVAKAIHELEDHDLLRGRLFAFSLDATTLPARAKTFGDVTTNQVLPRLGAALLTKGDYSRALGWRRQFGVAGQRQGTGSWRDVLTAGSRDSCKAMRLALDRLLVDVAARAGTAKEALEDIVRTWLSEREADGVFDWRYYFVRYPSMLAAPRGIYVGDYDATGPGYRSQVDMMNGRDYRSAFKDPYLYAIWNEIDRPERLEKPEFRSWDYTGTEKAMKLIRSGTGIRTLDEGFQLLLPEETTQAEAAVSALARFEIDADHIIRVKKSGSGDLDAEDRVQVGVAVVQVLLASDDL